MNGKKLVSVFFLLVFAFGLALPTSSVAARKQVYKAVLSTGAELHEVVDSSARGAALLTSAPDGSFNFIAQVRNLSGPVTGAHIHGPATESENAPVLITLCSGASCTHDSDGNLVISGNIGPAALQAAGITGAQFLSWLEGGLLYVNAHTALNPAGEARGQLFTQ